MGNKAAYGSGLHVSEASDTNTIIRNTTLTTVSEGLIFCCGGTTFNSVTTGQICSK